MRSKLFIGAGMIAGLCSMTAFAEPAVQPGETLESLSQVKISTTVNGQQGSLADLISSGQVQVLSGAATPPQGAPLQNPQDIQAVSPQQGPLADPAASPDQPPVDPNAANALPQPPEAQDPAMQASPEAPQDQDLNAAPEQIMTDPSAE